MSSHTRTSQNNEGRTALTSALLVFESQTAIPPCFCDGEGEGDVEEYLLRLRGAPIESALQMYENIIGQPVKTK